MSYAFDQTIRSELKPLFDVLRAIMVEMPVFTGAAWRYTNRWSYSAVECEHVTRAGRILTSRTHVQMNVHLNQSFARCFVYEFILERKADPTEYRRQ